VNYLLQNSKVPLDTNSNDFYSIIPYDYDINNNYFYYAYHPILKSYNYFIKFNYNSISNNISFVKENHFVSVYEAYDNVSCHMIDYNSKNNIICLMLSEFLGSKTFYFKILDPDNNFDILLETQIRKDFSDFIDSKTAIISKKDEQKILAILYYSEEIYWYGYNINTKSLKYDKFDINSFCSIIVYHRDISYFYETNEFIISFIGHCLINKKRKYYIFIYSFDNYFNCRLLGAIRTFTLGDSCEICNPFDMKYNHISLNISYNILYSNIEKKYCIISNVLYNNNIGVSLFILNINNSFHYSNNIICENYSNFKDSNCLDNDLIDDLYNNKIDYIQTCNNDYEEIELYCNSYNYSHKIYSDIIT
jgi:hypothetical protein